MENQFPFETKRYGAATVCSYCPSAEGLTEEHIIPLALGGKQLFPSSSCNKCRVATCKVEDFVLREYLGPLRSYLNLPSRRPKQRPTGYELRLSNGTRVWDQKVSLDKHPGVIKFMVLEPPGIIAGREKEPPTFSLTLETAVIFADSDNRLRALGATSGEDKVNINALSIARMLIKIGIAFAIAELGKDSFEEFFPLHLVQAEAKDWGHWVGGYHRGRNIAPDTLHQLRFKRRSEVLSVIVHLFVPYFPGHAHEVVVGRLKPGVVLPADLMETLEAVDGA
jgi:hypothetical protein